MKTTKPFLCALLTILFCGLFSCHNKPVENDEVAVLETNYGRIVVEFLPDSAPKHVANFKELARGGFYDGTKIHRIVHEKSRTVAIQGGDPNTINGDPSSWGQGQPEQKK